MGTLRLPTLMIAAGGMGMLVGRILQVSPTDPKPAWSNDGDLRLALGLNLILLGLAAWHFRRFGAGKLLAIGVLAFGALWLTLFDFGDGDPVWSQGYSGDDLVGAWMVIASSALVLLGVLWSNFRERPEGSKNLWQYIFGGGAGGSGAEQAYEGLVVGEGQAPPEGWWQAADGRWYPPGANRGDGIRT